MQAYPLKGELPEYFESCPNCSRYEEFQRIVHLRYELSEHSMLALYYLKLSVNSELSCHHTIAFALFCANRFNLASTISQSCLRGIL